MSLLLISLSASAQYADDALRISQVYYQGTARSAALGGSMGAIGGDFLSASTNPAGMGFYRSGVYSITPEVSATRTSSIYNGSAAEDSRAILNLSNMGYIVAKPLNSAGWKFFQFGMGMNRLNNYNNRVFIQGQNSVNSKLNAYQYNADGISYDQLEYYDAYELYPAWYLYLLDTIPGTTDQYYTPVENGGMLQQQSIFSRGSTNEWLFTFSGNYSDKLYIGATIGLPYTRYYRETTYQEFDVADTIPDLDQWGVTEKLTTTGWGINLKLGMIVKPTEWLRIGGAFHTPTYYWSMSDTWYTNTYAIFNGESDAITSPNGNFDYRLTTPLRAIGSAGIVIMQNGFLSFDYEYADYSNAKFSARAYSFGEVNSDISNVFKATHNFRGGLEWRYSKFNFRGGYALYGSPYDNDLNDGKRQVFSGGIGYRTNLFAIDFAYVRSVQNEDYYLYTTADVQSNPVSNEYLGQRFMFSIKYFMN